VVRLTRKTKRNLYTYPDPYLSLWQTAAAEVMASRDRASRLGLTRSVRNLDAPVHAAGFAAAAGLKTPQPSPEGLGVVGDCGVAATKFLWAEMTGNREKAKLYSDMLKKSACDAAGWSTCLATYLAYKAQGGVLPYRANINVVIPIDRKSRIAIIGDWGTGEDVAVGVLNEVKKRGCDLLVHLGDIYYSGTHHEVKTNFLDICRGLLGANCPVFTLCGNHDMYSGGEGYYWLVDQLGQRASYFALKNADWQLLAIDTGHNDCNPMTVSVNMTSVNDGEVQWRLGEIENAERRKTVLLSHHQLFSAFTSVGRGSDGKSYAYNSNLHGSFHKILDRVEWWFWGHEHNLAVYEPYMGLKRGRCLGASAVPVFKDQQSYTADRDLLTLGGQLPNWNSQVQLGNNGTDYHHAFAILTLDSATASVDYFQMPVRGSSVRLWTEALEPQGVKNVPSRIRSTSLTRTSTKKTLR
jgi:hypothetical protein